MTIEDDKSAIAAAVGAVAGVTGYASRPKVLKAGDAFIRWRGWSRDNGPAGAAFQSTFAVIIVVPQGTEDAADGWIYAHADLLEDALRPVMFVDSFEPGLLPVEGSAKGLYTLVITGRSE